MIRDYPIVCHYIIGNIGIVMMIRSTRLDFSHLNEILYNFYIFWFDWPPAICPIWKVFSVLGLQYQFVFYFSTFCTIYIERSSTFRRLEVIPLRNNYRPFEDEICASDRNH